MVAVAGTSVAALCPDGGDDGGGGEPVMGLSQSPLGYPPTSGGTAHVTGLLPGGMSCAAAE
jgi:hypothetical protein